VTAFDNLKAALSRKLTDQQPGSVDLNTETANLNALIAADDALPLAQRTKPLDDLTQAALNMYPQLALFLQNMSPYGLDVVMMPDLNAAAGANLKDLAALNKTFGIQVAGWLQASTHENPMASSDAAMGKMDIAQSFQWELPFPDDLTALVTEPDGTIHRPPPVTTRQITKAIRIPFIYRHDRNAAPPTAVQVAQGHLLEGQLLLGHIVIGFEGAGNT
jgi:hypothetical protein